MRTMLEPQRLIQLLARDPDLGTDLPQNEQRRARERVVVPTVTLAVGDEGDLARQMDHPGLIGFLVVEGLLLREIGVAGSVAAELIGSGDLIHPGDVRASDLPPLDGRLCWTVLDAAELALLDGNFTVRAAPWPQIFGRITLRRYGGRTASH